MDYVAGLDGGGTRTRITVVSAAGERVHTFTAGPLNYNGQDEAVVAATLREIADQIGQVITTQGGRALESCLVLCVGAAGISNPQVAGRVTQSLRASGYNGELLLVGDHETALYGAHGGESGIILIAGTGSICYGRNRAGAIHRAGGYGHLMDDEGSGYAIGRELLAAVVRAADGRSRSTVITDLIYERLAIDSVEKLVGYVYEPGRSKKDIAALAPLLTAACEAGDRQGQAIAAASATGLVPLVEAVAGRLGMPEGPLALLGSVLSANRFVHEALINQLGTAMPGLAIVPQQHDAAYGAALMALQRLRQGGTSA